MNEEAAEAENVWLQRPAEGQTVTSILVFWQAAGSTVWSELDLVLPSHFNLLSVWEASAKYHCQIAASGTTIFWHVMSESRSELWPCRSLTGCRMWRLEITLTFCHLWEKIMSSLWSENYGLCRSNNLLSRWAQDWPEALLDLTKPTA